MDMEVWFGSAVQQQQHLPPSVLDVNPGTNKWDCHTILTIDGMVFPIKALTFTSMGRVSE